MATLKILTWNVRGLGDRAKRTAVLSHLKSQGAEISILVETHLIGQKQMSLKKPWVGWAYHAPYTSNSHGIEILVAKTAQFQLHNLRSDPQGRSLFLHVTVGGLEFLLLTFYIPPPFQFTMLQQGIDFMSQYPSVPAIWAGDFNAVIAPHYDRISPANPTPPTSHTTRFWKFLIEFALTPNTWRHLHPTQQRFSCFTPSRSSMSRIDYIFFAPSLLLYLTEAGFDVRVLSDHSPYWIRLQLPSPSITRIWRLNPFWLTILPDLDGLQHEWDHYFSTNDGTALTGSTWEAFKMHARMILSTRINRHKATSKQLISQAEEHLHTLEQNQNSPTAANASLVHKQSRLTNQLHFEKAKQGIFFSKQRVYEHGERAGKLRAYMAHLDHKPPVVVSLQTASGVKTTDPEQVAE